MLKDNKFIKEIKDLYSAMMLEEDPRAEQKLHAKLANISDHQIP